MKEKWERTKPSLTLTDQKIAGMVHSFLPKSKLISAQLLGGGFSNTNYKTQLESWEAPMVLRVCKQENCKIESALHRKLYKRMPVPEVYYSECRVERSFMIMEWIDGIQLKNVMYSREIRSINQVGYSVGCWLSEMRKYKFMEPGIFDEHLNIATDMTITPYTFVSWMEEFLIDGQTGYWLGEELTGKLLDFSHRNSIYLKDIINDTPALVHSDYNGLNILVEDHDGKCEVTGIIDWEFAFSGPVYVDIGNMLRYENIPHYANFEHAFIEGLQSEGMWLPSDWKRIAKLVDLIALCGLLNNNDCGPNRVDDIKHLINQTLDNWADY